MYDIAVIGAGPSGLTAAVYASRAGKKVLIIESSSIGGQIASSPKVENFPTYKSISGMELGDKLFEQATSLGAELELAEIIDVKKTDRGFELIHSGGKFVAKSVIIATGAKHRTLGLDREEEFVGNGVGYCVVCDGEFYRGKDVAIVGGGNTALQSAIYLSNICRRVIILQNLAFLTGEKMYIDQLKTKKNVLTVLSTVVTKLNGSDKLESVEIETSGKKQTLKLDGLFINIGQKPETNAFKNVCDINEYGYIVADESCTTKTSGLFVAGDCRTKRIRQLTTAVGDGSIAAISACSYVDSL